MKRLIFEAAGMADTDRLGTVLAEELPPGTTVALCGTLGSGKTRLVQAIAAACGLSREDIVSPTFVLCQEYHGKRDIFHWDAYRLHDEDEFMQLGPEECFASPALVFIEWAERVREALPAEYIEIRIEVTGDSSRSFQLAAEGTRFDPVIAAIEKRLALP
jgi:tRNA threonylcarbamoyladenosine biosynthesis protein TsaE